RHFAGATESARPSPAGDPPSDRLGRLVLVCRPPWAESQQEIRGLRRINSHFCRKRLHLLGTECLLNLIARDGLVFAHADPGGKNAATAALRKLIGQTLQSPALRQETAENSYERIRFARSIRFSARCTEYRIEKSHSFIVLLI